MAFLRRFRALESLLLSPVRSAHHFHFTSEEMETRDHELVFSGFRPLVPQLDSWFPHHPARNECPRKWDRCSQGKYSPDRRIREQHRWLSAARPGTRDSPSGVWDSFGGLGTSLHRPSGLLLLLGSCEVSGSCDCLFLVLSQPGFFSHPA